MRAMDERHITEMRLYKNALSFHILIPLEGKKINANNVG